MTFARLRLLIARQWLENYKVYLISAAAMTGILSLLFGVTWHWRTSFPGARQNGIYLIGLFAGGPFFNALSFRDLGSRSTAIWLLCLPASATEKLASAILIGIVAYALVYTGIFYGVETIFCWLVNDDHKKVGHTQFFENGFYKFIFSYISVQVCILLGSLAFDKLAFLKTILLLIIGFPLLNTFNNYLLGWLTGIHEITSNIPFNYFQFSYKGDNVYVYLPERVQTIVDCILNYGLPIVLIYNTWLKLKEKEV